MKYTNSLSNYYFENGSVGVRFTVNKSCVIYFNIKYCEYENY